jgi:fatty acid desaturase
METSTRSGTGERGSPAGQAPSDYAELSRLVRAAGLLRRRPGYYTAKILLTVAALLAGWVVFVVVGDSWWQLLVAAFLGMAFTQVAFIGHDVGHKQIFRTRRAAYAAGLLLGNLGVGLSYGWWVDKHNRHHAHPNQIGADPDIEVGALVYSARQAAGRRGLGRWLARRQALAFVAVHQAVFGLYMGLSFAPNHKGMPVLDAGQQPDFLRRQVLTSRNVRGGPLTDFALGGLNYQIEHHLFPSMPRPNLRRAQALVRDFCASHHIGYAQTGPLRSYGLVLRHLYDVGAPIRTAGTG